MNRRISKKLHLIARNSCTPGVEMRVQGFNRSYKNREGKTANYIAETAFWPKNSFKAILKRLKKGYYNGTIEGLNAA